MGTSDVRWSWTQHSMNFTSTGNTDANDESGRQHHIQISHLRLRTVNGITEVQSSSTTHPGQPETHSR
jgi:hypothetical protein